MSESRKSLPPASTGARTKRDNVKTHPRWATGSNNYGTRRNLSPLGFDYDVDPNAYLDHGTKPPTRLRIVKPD